jgi:hypothetical protein
MAAAPIRLVAQQATRALVRDRRRLLQRQLGLGAGEFRFDDVPKARPFAPPTGFAALGRGAERPQMEIADPRRLDRGCQLVLRETGPARSAGRARLSGWRRPRRRASRRHRPAAPSRSRSKTAGDPSFCPSFEKINRIFTKKPHQKKKLYTQMLHRPCAEPGANAGREHLDPIFVEGRARSAA